MNHVHMGKRLSLILLAVLPAAAQDISGERIRAHVKFLSSDLLEGRGVGVRGGDLATEYIAAQLALAGAKPAAADGRSWFQPVPLVGVQTEPGAKLRAGDRDFAWLTDFVGTVKTQVREQDFDGEAVFAGHGITAPEFGWDDYAGADVRGKVVLLFTNEPPSDDAAFFGGRALTYYGRWTYKYEEALRRGAAAVLILHTNQTAGYGWEVVRNSWGREDFEVKRSGPALAFAGWLTEVAAGRLVELAGRRMEDLLRMADSKGFRAVPLSLRIRGSVRSAIREIGTRNVAGIVRGSDPALAPEAVVYSAHWDHLGRNPDASGDGIYNGAVDNASGCGMVLEMARAWAGLPVKPRRSALFVFMAAEESGLRGAEYYAAHPLVPLQQTTLNLNFDSFYPFGRSKDVVLNGAERTTFWPQIQAVANRFELAISPDPRPEQGSYFRSDHFPFAKAGVPAFSVGGGTTFLANAEPSLEKLREYSSRHYHQPSDEYRDEWDFSNMEYLSRFGLALGLEAANAGERIRFAEPRRETAGDAKRRRPGRQARPAAGTK